MSRWKKLTAIGLLLIAAALCITAYNLWDSYRAGLAADAALRQLAIAEPVPMPDAAEPDEDPQEIEYPDYILNPEMDMPTQMINGNAYIGVLKFPTLNRELPVLSEWSYPLLKVAPCRYSGTAYMDNLVIAAHNYRKHFGPLSALHFGDSVSFTDMDGNEFLYEVQEVEVLQPTAIEEMTESPYDLTLFTCTLGGQSRLAVRCEKVQDN